jgi:hypothetical protein
LAAGISAPSNWGERVAGRAVGAAPADPALAFHRIRIQQRYFTEYDRVLDENRDESRSTAGWRRSFAGSSISSNGRIACWRFTNAEPRTSAAAAETFLAAPTGRATTAESDPIPERMDGQPDIRSPLVDYLRELKTTTARIPPNCPATWG